MAALLGAASARLNNKNNDNNPAGQTRLGASSGQQEAATLEPWSAPAFGPPKRLGFNFLPQLPIALKRPRCRPPLAPTGQLVIYPARLLARDRLWAKLGHSRAAEEAHKKRQSGRNSDFLKLGPPTVSVSGAHQS